MNPPIGYDEGIKRSQYRISHTIERTTFVSDRPTGNPRTILRLVDKLRGGGFEPKIERRIEWKKGEKVLHEEDWHSITYDELRAIIGKKDTQPRRIVTITPPPRTHYLAVSRPED